jgi:hypothetical protein
MDLMDTIPLELASVEKTLYLIVFANLLDLMVHEKLVFFLQEF